jgi:hypothetical protein
MLPLHAGYADEPVRDVDGRMQYSLRLLRSNGITVNTELMMYNVVAVVMLSKADLGPGEETYLLSVADEQVSTAPPESSMEVALSMQPLFSCGHGSLHALCTRTVLQ